MFITTLHHVLLKIENKVNIFLATLSIILDYRLISDKAYKSMVKKKKSNMSVLSIEYFFLILTIDI